MREQLQHLAMGLVDLVMAVLPRRVPRAAMLRDCKIISHRGEHDNNTVKENTLQAFVNARAAGVWGIECDIRWTADGVPVICHDDSASRVFGRAFRIGDLAFAELRTELPLVPSLQEVIEEFGGNTHLMLELKEQSATEYEHQRETLRRLLSGLEPGRDFHILSLDARLFSLVDFLAPIALLPVAETNLKTMSRLCLERGYGGVTGHYLLLGKSLKKAHEQAGQAVGTGFPRSRNCLYRELNRGVEWIFSNDAVYLQGLLNEVAGKR